jgi:hypothetical protein
MHPNLTGVASNSLYQVGRLYFGHSPALQTLSFPNLTKADFLSFYLTELPLLTELDFGASLTIPYGTFINGTGLKSFSASLPAPPYPNLSNIFSYPLRHSFGVMQNKDMSQIHLGLEVYNDTYDNY